MSDEIEEIIELLKQKQDQVAWYAYLWNNAVYGFLSTFDEAELQELKSNLLKE